jgi:hypothetical protein
MENEWGFSLIGDRWASTESVMIRALPQAEGLLENLRGSGLAVLPKPLMPDGPSARQVLGIEQ